MHPSEHSCLSLVMPTAPATQHSCFLLAAITTPTCEHPTFPFLEKSTPLLFGAARKSTRTPPGECPGDPSLPRPPLASPDSWFSSTRDGRNGSKRSAGKRSPEISHSHPHACDLVVLLRLSFPGSGPLPSACCISPTSRPLAFRPGDRAERLARLGGEGSNKATMKELNSR